MQNHTRLIGEIMVALEYVSLDQINDARRYQMEYTAKRLGECLVELGYATETQVQRSLDVQNIT